MDEILKVDEDKRTISARDLQKQLESHERFSEWFNRVLQYGFVEGQDFTSVGFHTLVNNGAERELQDYALTMDMAKQICMLQRSDKGRQCRQYLIDLEKAWNSPEVIYSRALKMADRQLNDLKRQNMGLLAAVDRMKPKEVFADAVAGSDGSILIGELAKLLKQNGVDTGETRLFIYMRENGYLISRKGNDYNLPTQRSMELKIFEIKERVVSKKDGSQMLVKTPYVTGKGQQYFINKFLEQERQ